MNRFIISAAELCKACGACEVACVQVHAAVGLQAYPRLHETKTSRGIVHIQCRHCEDAPCTDVCPVAAISHGIDTIDLNESTCIGCKMCALACPFGAIAAYGSSPQSQQLPDAGHDKITLPPRSSLFEWFAGVRTVAIKCDLCYFRADGPKCVEVCPTRALRVIDDETFADAAGTKKRQSAELMSQMP
ncbi:MAG: 4Fe-4S dicluster domain-containing protein [Alphaproteobacteria bacterium]|nr:4Fe-4S dicluster domain-containing protein [Alphaproteobacteria bacterium]